MFFKLFKKIGFVSAGGGLLLGKNIKFLEKNFVDFELEEDLNDGELKILDIEHLNYDIKKLMVTKIGKSHYASSAHCPIDNQPLNSNNFIGIVFLVSFFFFFLIFYFFKN